MPSLSPSQLTEGSDMNRRGALLVVLMAAVVLALAPGASAQAKAQPQAQTWPVRPVRFIVSLGPGSGVDISARLLADRLTARWNRTVVVENRPGADGVLAITTFITA